MSIVPQPYGSSASFDNLLVESALFESGRPGLVVPYSTPLLSLVKSIGILMIKKKDQDSDRSGDAIIKAHLARQGFDAKLADTPTDIDIASTILSHAADSAACLIVTGGDGHSPLRELILGEVTQGILKTMTVPVPMSH